MLKSVLNLIEDNTSCILLYGNMSIISNLAEEVIKSDLEELKVLKYLDGHKLIIGLDSFIFSFKNVSVGCVVFPHLDKLYFITTGNTDLREIPFLLC